MNRVQKICGRIPYFLLVSFFTTSSLSPIVMGKEMRFCRDDERIEATIVSIRSTSHVDKAKLQKECVLTTNRFIGPQDLQKKCHTLHDTLAETNLSTS